MEEALPSLGEAKEDSRLLPGLRPQAGQGTGVETARCCGLTMGGSERAVEGLIARPLTLQGLGICCPTRSGFGGRGWPPGGSPEGARFPKVQVGAKEALRPQPLHWLNPPPWELASTQSPQLGASCSVGSPALLPATSCFWSWPLSCPLLGLRHRADPGS